MESQRLIAYDLIISQCKTDGAEGATVYGIRCINSKCTVEDISSNKEDVVHLINLLTQADVEQDQLLYIIEDYIAN